MKKSFWTIMLTLIMLINITIVGCSTPKTETGGEKQKSQPEAASSKPKFLTIGTAPSGGAYYPIGITMADIITNKLGIQTTAQVTGGAVENNTLIQTKKVDIAITQSSMAYAAYKSQDPYKEKCENINILFNGLSTGVFHVVVMKNSGINSMTDLKGKKVVMGPAGGGAINMAKDIWGEYGFGIEDVKATYVSYSDGISSLKDGKVDAVVVQSAPPASAIKELAATTKDFKLLSVEEDKKKKILEKYPYYAELKISKDMYGASEDATVIYVTNLVTVSKDLPEALVYDVTKAIFENLDKVKESNPAAKGVSLDTAAKNLPIPMHPGAAKYFKEKGALK